MEQKKQILLVKVDMSGLTAEYSKQHLENTKKNVQAQLGSQLEYFTVVVMATYEGDTSEINTLL